MAIGALETIPPPSNMEMNSKNRLNVAIIGCGAIYRNHADALVKNEHVKLSAVVDISEDRAQNAGNLFNCDFYEDYKKIIEDPSIDVIHICTPHYLHAPMAVEALCAGKHVFTEKPISINTKAAEEMIKAAKDNNRYLGVCFQNRYNATSMKAKEILEGGSLGRIKGVKGLVTWFRDKDYYVTSGWRGNFHTEGGGTLINQSIHTIDLMAWLAGEIEYVRANVDTRVLDDVIEVEDTADATFYYKNGAVGIFYATNCYSTNSPVELEIHCELGTLQIVDEELYLKKDNNKTLLASDRFTEKGLKSYWGASHGKLIDRFYQSIMEDIKDYVPGEEGIKSIQIIEAIYKSSATHNKIKV